MPEAVFGNRSVYCHGRCYMGKSNFQAMISLIAIIILPNVYIFFGSQSLDFDDNTTWIIVSTIFGLELFTLTCFVALVVSDPGILVKPLSEIRSEDYDEFKLVEYNQRMYALKYCITCKFHRPLRSSHCRECDVCIDELDHHCPWVANCIAKRNRGLFLWFLIFALALSSEITVLSVMELSSVLPPSEFNSEFFKKYAVELGLGGLAGLISLFVGGLLIFQIILIGRGLTTNEVYKKIYKEEENPFDEGCCMNYWNFLKRDAASQSATVEYYNDLEKLIAQMELKGTRFSTMSIRRTNTGRTNKSKRSSTIEFKTMKTSSSEGSSGSPQVNLPGSRNPSIPEDRQLKTSVTSVVDSPGQKQSSPSNRPYKTSISMK